MLRIAAAILAIAVAAASTLSPADSASTETTIIYVNAAASGANDGTSWRDAFTDLQDALGIAVAGDEIWVATGTYRPGPPDAGPTATFSLVSGASLYGGFAGWETELDQRDWTANPVVLTGELASDVHAATVMTSVVPSDGTLVDGVLIESGLEWSALGAGLRQSGGALVVRNTELRDHVGGAVRIENAELVLQQCSFIDNFMFLSEARGNVHAINSILVAVECSFIGNEAGQGGAIATENSQVILELCTFTDNTAWFGGSAIKFSGSALYIRDCAFENNSGGVALLGSSDMTLENSIVRHNSGGYLNTAGNPMITITGSQFILNVSDSVGGANIFGSGAQIEIRDSIFDSNTSGQRGGGLHIDTDSTALISNTQFNLNWSTLAGGGLATTGGGTTRMENCSFEANTGYLGGGSAVMVSNGSLEMLNCRVAENDGWPINARNGANLALINSLVDSNFMTGVTVGHFAAGAPATAEIINSTITNTLITDPVWQAGVYVFPESHATIRNSILWNNGSGVESDQIKGSADVSHSIVQGFQAGGAYSGPAVSGDDPLFADEDGRLSKDSPAIDAGLNELLPDDIDTDLDGNPRIVDGTGDGEKIVDMGAYEFQSPAPGIPGDLNGDGVVDVQDLIILLLAWGPCAGDSAAMGVPPAEPGAQGSCPADLNGDGVVDVLDLLILLDHWG